MCMIKTSHYINSNKKCKTWSGTVVNKACEEQNMTGSMILASLFSN